jgi:hypothetical protein
VLHKVYGSYIYALFESTRTFLCVHRVWDMPSTIILFERIFDFNHEVVGISEFIGKVLGLLDYDEEIAGLEECTFFS